MATFIHLLASILYLLLFVYAVTTWFLPPYNAFRVAIARVVEPVLAPIRRVIRPVSGIDFSILVLFFIIYILEQVLTILFK